MARTIRLLLADNHPAYMEGLVALFREEPDIEVVGCAVNGQEALELALELEPDIVLMDISMPVMDGLEATRRVKKSLPGVKVLVCTMHNSPEYAVQATEAGAVGFVTKDLPFAALLPTVKAVQAGVIVLPPPPPPPPAPPPPPKTDLTETEARVFVLMVQGVERNSSYQRLTSSGAIARALGMATRTVEAHRASIRDKLGNLTPVEMVRYALKHGLIDDEMI